jgi:hypothetical protein
MKIVGGRKFALNKHDRPMVIRKKMPKALRKASYQSKTHWMYGSLGPASPVRRIDPATGEVVAVIPAHD